MRTSSVLAITSLIAGFLALPGAAAQAMPSDTFGSHVRPCAQSMHVSGSHNPGSHRGASGWDGTPCH